MTEKEMANYVTTLENSTSNKFKEEVDARLQTRRRLDTATDFFTDQSLYEAAASHLGFELIFYSSEGPDLWILIKFQDFKGVSKSDKRDVLHIGFRNNTLLVSSKDLQPLGLATLERTVSAEIPPLQPTLYGDVRTPGYLTALEVVLVLLLALQILAFL